MKKKIIKNKRLIHKNNKKAMIIIYICNGILAMGTLEFFFKENYALFTIMGIMNIIIIHQLFKIEVK